MNLKFSFSALTLFLLSASAKTQSFEGKNLAKVNVPALVAKSINFQYEKQIGKRWTVALGYSKIPTSNIAFKSFIEKQIDDPDVKVGDFKLGTSILTPEVRFYVGKKGAFHGFYLAPYARLGKYKLEGPVSYTTSTGTRKDLVFSGTVNSTTGGLMVGSSFNLHKRLYLDWWIIGASIGGANGSFNAQTTLTAVEQQSLRSELKDIDIPFTTIESNVNGNGAVVNTTGTMVGIRGLGLNIGIRF